MNQLQKFKKNTKPEHYILLALIFLLPFFFLPYTFAPVALGKQIISATLIFGAFIYFLARFLKKGTITLPPAGFLKAVSIFFGAVLISGIFSQARGISFLGNSSDSVVWTGLYSAGLLIAVILLKGETIVRTAAALFVSGSVILGFLTIFQLQGVDLVSVNPMGGMFAAGFVSAAVLAAIVSFLTIVGDIDKKYKIPLVSAAVLLGAVVAQINMWSIWMSLALGLAVSSLAIGSSILKQNKKSTKSLMPPFIVIIVSLFFIINPSAMFFESQHQVEEVGLTLRTTADITLNSLDGARFVYGTGPGTFQYNYLSNKPLSINETDFWSVGFAHGHSTITTNISTWGVLGVVAFLYLIFFLFKTIISSLFRAEDKFTKTLKAQEGIAVAGLSFFSVIVASLFMYRANATMMLSMFLVAGISVGALRTAGAIKAKKLNASANPQVLVLASLAALVLISASLASVYLLAQSYVAQAHAERAARGESIEQVIDGLSRAVQINPRDDMIRRLRSQAFALRLRDVLDSEDFTQQGVADRFSRIMQDAITDAEIATQINPQNPENWIQLGQVYESVIGLVQGAENMAVNSYERAFELDSRNPMLPLAQARSYLSLVDYMEAQAEAGTQTEQDGEEIIMIAIDKINEAIDLKRDFIPARLLLSSAYQRLGQLDKAIEETGQLFAENPLDPNLAFQLGVLYWEDGELLDAQEFLEASIDLAGGSFGNARYILGLIYDALGDTDAAIAQFEILLEDNPDNELIMTVISNLREGLPALRGMEGPLEEPLIEDFSEMDALDL